MSNYIKTSLPAYIYSLMDSKGRVLFFGMLFVTSLSSIIISVSPFLLAKITDLLVGYQSSRGSDFSI
ncbi:ABC transporter ATP-binding protein, partial [Salmonella enterica]|nr:ABC transporter ATP-binding protein [Salmonella enterica]